MRLNKYVDNSGYIDVRTIALGRNELLAEARRREQIVMSEQDFIQDLNRDFAVYILGCLVVTGLILYFGMS